MCVTAIVLLVWVAIVAVVVLAIVHALNIDQLPLVLTRAAATMNTTCVIVGHHRRQTLSDVLRAAMLVRLPKRIGSWIRVHRHRRRRPLLLLLQMLWRRWYVRATAATAVAESHRLRCTEQRGALCGVQR